MFHSVDIYKVFSQYRRFPSLLNVPAILIYILLLLAVVPSYISSSSLSLIVRVSSEF